MELKEGEDPKENLCECSLYGHCQPITQLQAGESPSVDDGLHRALVESGQSHIR